ncbi:LysE family translocator [Azospirillum endophyticum]
MQTLDGLALFVLAATISPGGATTLATASGMNFGYRRSLPLILGISLGLACMAAAAAAGIEGIFVAVPAIQTAVKIAGTLYLLWLALQLSRTGSPKTTGSVASPTSIAGGAWLVLYNPKGWAMTTGAAASFSSIADGPVETAALLGFAFGCFALFSLSVWCLGGQLLRRVLTRNWQWRALNIALALLLVASILPIWIEP